MQDSKISLKYLRSMGKEYENVYVMKWSFWMITATCCFSQVKSMFHAIFFFFLNACNF